MRISESALRCRTRTVVPHRRAARVRLVASPQAVAGAAHPYYCGACGDAILLAAGWLLVFVGILVADRRRCVPGDRVRATWFLARCRTCRCSPPAGNDIAGYSGDLAS